jgi:signal transduction histidine kinase
MRGRIRQLRTVGQIRQFLTAATKNLGDRVEIRIRDNGTGIPPEVKDKSTRSLRPSLRHR